MNGPERHLLPDLPLDDLLQELQSRLDAVVAARDGVHALLDAVVSIGADLDLETVLRRIVEAAKTLVDCRYAALGVIGEDGQLAEFVPVGMSLDEISKIAEWPHGRGLLGLLIQQPQTLRLPDIADHPASYGFPPGHPPMRRFLGVPIRVRDDVFGNLYLTEKSGGREFDSQDEAIISALAAAAGVAIENARLYEETRTREIWLDASSEVTRRLLSGEDPGDVLALVARRAREMCNAVAVAVVLPVTADDPGSAGRTLRAEAVDGVDDMRGLEVPVAGTLLGSVLLDGKPRLITDMDAVDEATPLVNHMPPGPVLLVPLGADDSVRGVMVASRRPGGLPFTAATMRMLGDFGRQVAVVMELAEARRESERHGLIDDRERIARDLHDVVIQRLYATGMLLMGAAKLTDKPEVTQRMQSAVDAMDETVRQIRSTIFALQAPPSTHERRLRTKVTEIVQLATEQLGFAPGLRMEGLLDTNVPDTLADDATAALRESLSNVVRHSQATQCDVVVELTDGQLRLTVTDDGIGIPEHGRRSGLANLADRAARWSGSFAASAMPSGGTTLHWTARVEPEGR